MGMSSKEQKLIEDLNKYIRFIDAKSQRPDFITLSKEQCAALKKKISGWNIGDSYSGYKTKLEQEQ
jgi:hypothetical protein